MHHCQSDPAFAFGYFYFDFRDPAKQRYENLVRSLIEQLSDQSSGTPEALRTLYSQNQDGARQPTVKVLVETLRGIIRGFKQTYIIVDALDECSEREKLLVLIGDIIDWKIGTLHILATSRKEQDIEDYLSSLISDEINIQSTFVDADIQVHVRERLRNDRRLRKWSVDAQLEIETALVDGAHGM